MTGSGAVMETQVASAVAQFGAAGLIGWMWLTERRGAAVRDRQLTEAHQRLVREGGELGALVSVVQRNTRALEAVAQGQRRLASLLERVLMGRRSHAGSGR